MPRIITRIEMFHRPHGSGVDQMSEIIQHLSTLGFTVSLGNFDYEYEWETESVTTDDVITLVDQVLKALDGYDIYLRFNTLSEIY